MEAARSPWPALGVLLVRDGLIDADQLDDILSSPNGDDERLSNRCLGEVLVERGLVTSAQVARMIAEQHELPFVDLDDPDSTVPLTISLTEDVARRHQALPIRRFPDGSLLVVVGDPTRPGVFEDLRRAVGVPTRFAVAAPEAIDAAIDQASEGGRFRAPGMVDLPPLLLAAPGEPPLMHLMSAPGIAEPSESSWPVIGSLLLRDGLVTEDELESALAQQRLSSTRRLGEILVQRGALTERQIAQVLAEQHELTFVDLREERVDPEAASRLPLRLVRELDALPVSILPGGSLLVAVTDPTSTFQSDRLRATLDGPFQLAVAVPDELEEAIAELEAAHSLEPVVDTAEVVPVAEHADPEPELELDETEPLGVAEQAEHALHAAEPGLEGGEPESELELPEREPVVEDADAEPDVEEETTPMSLFKPFASISFVDRGELEADDPELELVDAEPGASDAEPKIELFEAAAFHEPELTVEEDVAEADVVEPTVPVSFFALSEPPPEVADETDSELELVEPEPVVEPDEPEPRYETQLMLPPAPEATTLDEEALGEPPEQPAPRPPELTVVEGVPSDNGRVTAEIEVALALGATAVHVMSRGDGVVVRARIGDSLEEVAMIESSEPGALMAALADVAALGRARFMVEGRTVELRPAVLPTVLGERITFRVVEDDISSSELEEMLGTDVTDVVRTALESQTGLVAICSSSPVERTSALYAALHEGASSGRTVLSLEDPVEVLVAGVDQVEVDPRAGVTFATGLHTILRSDPDLAVVGELLDPETARLATRGALTQALVVTTLAAGSAAEGARRLLELGAEPDTLAEALACVVATRRVRTSCLECRTASYATLEELTLLGLPPEEAGRRLVARTKGCAACDGTGYAGWVHVAEALPLTDDVRRLVAAGASLEELTRAAAEAGMRTIVDAAVELCLEGATTPSEATRLVGAAR